MGTPLNRMNRMLWCGCTSRGATLGLYSPHDTGLWGEWGGGGAKPEMEKFIPHPLVERSVLGDLLLVRHGNEEQHQVLPHLQDGQSVSRGGPGEERGVVRAGEGA